MMMSDVRQIIEPGSTAPVSGGAVYAALSGLGTTKTVVSQAEQQVGIYVSEDGAELPIYERAFALADLPTEVDAISEAVLSGEPLGFGRYLRVVSLEVVTKAGEFLFDRFAIDRIHTVAHRTVANIRCLKPVDAATEAILRLRYVKFFGDRLRFSVTLPDGVDPATVGLSAAPLKYDKHFAFTYTADDSVAGAYSRVWRRIHRKWMDDQEFFHLGNTPSTGYMPNEALTMTDGCGNQRRFGFSCAIWPTLGDSYNPHGRIKDSATGTSSIYVSWEELRLMEDFGVSVCFHNVDERTIDKTDSKQIFHGLEADNARAYAKLGHGMKVMGLPDGNAAYLTAARQSPLVQFVRSSLSNELIRLHTVDALTKCETYGGQHTSDVAAKLTELAEQAASDNPYWVGITSHRVSLEVVRMLETIYQLYGAAGADICWVASWDEVFEYVAMRSGMSVERAIDGQTITFDICVPAGRAFLFRELTFLLSGAAGAVVTPLSENIKGLNFAQHTARWTGEDGVLLNVNFDAAAETRAERYTAAYEKSGDPSDKEDARYFASLMLPELAAPYMARIEAVTALEAPILRGLKINGGAAATTSRSVTLTPEYDGTATRYRLDESDDLSAEAWTAYAGGAIPCMLSDGEGIKTLYLQIGNSAGDSDVVSASIAYAAPEEPIIELRSVTLDGGAAVTKRREVTVHIDASAVPTHYRAGETADLTAEAWKAYAGDFSYTLSDEQGTKTLYVQVKDHTGESAACAASILYQPETAPTVMRALISLGWDNSLGVAVGGSSFNASMQCTCTRPNQNAAFTFDFYNTEGNKVGSITASPMKLPGATYQGTVTGDDSGIYPDDLLKRLAYPVTTLDEGVISIDGLPAGRYGVKLLINHNWASLDVRECSYTLETDGSAVQQFTFPNSGVGNTRETTEQLIVEIIDAGAIRIRIKQGSSNFSIKPINVIEITNVTK